NDAKEKLQAWQIEYNESRPHRALKNLSPREFVDQWVAQPSETPTRWTDKRGPFTIVGSRRRRGPVNGAFHYWVVPLPSWVSFREEGQRTRSPLQPLIQ